jgi:PAS domain S-box-containing protein
MDWGYGKETGLHATLALDSAESVSKAWESRALASSLPHYFDLLEALGDAVILSDAEDRIVFLNAEAERIFGYDRTELIGCPVTMLMPADITLGRTPRRMDVQGLRKDGGAFDAAVALSKINLGVSCFVTAVIRDVSSEKKLERALRESERLLRRSQEVAGVGSWAWDAKTGHQVWSDEFYRLLGLRPGEIAPTYENYLAYTHPEDRAKYCGPDLGAWARRLQAGRVYPDQHVRIMRPDGSIRWMRRWFGVETDADGTISGATGTLQDVTEQRLASDKLRLSDERLKRAQRIAMISSWERDMVTGELTWSDQMSKLLGPPPDGMTVGSDEVRSRLLPEDRTLVERRFNEAIANRLTEQSFDVRSTAWDGSERAFRLNYEFDWGSGDRLLKLAGTAQDITEDKRAAERLELSEKRLRRAQKIARIGSWELNAQGEHSWTDELFRIFGFKPGSVAPDIELFESLVHPEDRALLQRAMNEARAQRLKDRTLDVRITRPDGVERIINQHVEYAWSLEGELISMAGTSQDVTEERRAAERLALSEKRLRRAQEIAQIGSWELNRQGEYSWTDELFRIYGFEPGSVTPGFETFLSAVHPDDQALIHRLIDDARAQRLKDQTQDVRIIRPDGVERIVNQHVEYSWSPEGELLSTAGTAQDVTEWRIATERLRQSERLLRRAQELNRIGSWEYDLRTKRVSWSDHLFELFGVDPGATMLTTESFLGMIHPDDQQINIQRFEEAVAQRLATQSFDTRIIRADGEERILHALYEFDWADGEMPSKVTGTGQDVTEERAAQQALQQALHAAEEANRAKSAFLANMSHELRTPLNAIIGFAELIRTTGQKPQMLDKVSEYADHIHSSGTHLLEIICDILDLSRVEAGSLILAEETIAIPDLVDWALNMIRPQARAGCVCVRSDLPAQLPAIFGDKRLMRESLLNLLSNAVKFTPEGGSVQVSVTTEAQGDLVIAVRDSGIGMRAEDIPAALAPFTQLENTLTRRYEGTGLGLPLTKKFVELHGGTLEIESAPGQGTSVRMTIPADRCRPL